jgi:hypothetical protein
MSRPSTLAAWLDYLETLHPKAIAMSAAASARLRDTRASDNFRNLFELPVLFYAAALVAVQAGLVGTTTLLLAWAFVVLRVAHSVIQCSYNRVMHRFFVYAAGAASLWLLWATLAIGLLR